MGIKSAFREGNKFLFSTVAGAAIATGAYYTYLHRVPNLQDLENLGKGLSITGAAIGGTGAAIAARRNKGGAGGTGLALGAGAVAGGIFPLHGIVGGTALGLGTRNIMKAVPEEAHKYVRWAGYGAAAYLTYKYGNQLVPGMNSRLFGAAVTGAATYALFNTEKNKGTERPAKAAFFGGGVGLVEPGIGIPLAAGLLAWKNRDKLTKFAKEQQAKRAERQRQLAERRRQEAERQGAQGQEYTEEQRRLIELARKDAEAQREREAGRY